MPFFKTSIFAVALSLPFAAQAQTACEPYTVVSGDTLRLIAERVFGSRDLSPVIYNANRGVIGLNPNNIEIGMALDIPCDSTASRVVTITVPSKAIDTDDAGNATGGLNLPTIQSDVVEKPDAPAMEAPETDTPEIATITPSIVKVPVSTAPVETDDGANVEVVTSTPDDTSAPVEAVTEVTSAPAESVENTVMADTSGYPDSPTFISAGTFPPFSDGDGNGMMTDLVRAALGGAQYLNDTSTNAVSQPFDPLMASSDPDVILSYPWINPGCAEQTVLSSRSADLCSNYEFSAKAYDIVMTLFVADRSGLAQLTDASQFEGKRICVPEQYPTNHFVEAGFDPGKVDITRGNSVAECMSKLLSGQTDVVNADYLSVESTYAVLNSQSIIVENPSFTWIRSVHAIANVNSPSALQTLADFDNGLRRIRDSGEWNAIVTSYID